MLTENDKIGVRNGAAMIRKLAPETTLQQMKDSFRDIFPELTEEEYQESFQIIDEVFNASLN